MAPAPREIEVLRRWIAEAEEDGFVCWVHGRLGGRLTPSLGDVLEVSIGVVDDSDAALVLSAIVAGLEAMPACDRPAGHLDLSWMVIHPVDLKPWAWRDAAATMGRLLCEDVGGLDDAAAAELARGYAVGGSFG